jgi:hypothetical protein
MFVFVSVYIIVILMFFHFLKLEWIKNWSNLHLKTKRTENVVKNQIETFECIRHCFFRVRTGMKIWIATVKPEKAP